MRSYILNESASTEVIKNSFGLWQRRVIVRLAFLLFHLSLPPRRRFPHSHYSSLRAAAAGRCFPPRRSVFWKGLLHPPRSDFPHCYSAATKVGLGADFEQFRLKSSFRCSESRGKAVGFVARALKSPPSGSVASSRR